MSNFTHICSFLSVVLALLKSARGRKFNGDGHIANFLGFQYQQISSLFSIMPFNFVHKMCPGAKCREDDNYFRKVDQGQGHGKCQKHNFGNNFWTERRRNFWFGSGYCRFDLDSELNSLASFFLNGQIFTNLYFYCSQKVIRYWMVQVSNRSDENSEWSFLRNRMRNGSFFTTQTNF